MVELVTDIYINTAANIDKQRWTKKDYIGVCQNGQDYKIKIKQDGGTCDWKIKYTADIDRTKMN